MLARQRGGDEAKTAHGGKPSRTLAKFHSEGYRDDAKAGDDGACRGASAQPMSNPEKRRVTRGRTYRPQVSRRLLQKVVNRRCKSAVYFYFVEERQRRPAPLNEITDVRETLCARSGRLSGGHRLKRRSHWQHAFTWGLPQELVAGEAENLDVIDTLRFQILLNL